MIDHNSSKYQFLKRLGLSATNDGVLSDKWGGSGPKVSSVSPATGETIGEVSSATVTELDHCIQSSVEAWQTWADLPAPKRGEIVRQIGDALRANLDDLGALVSLEMGKIKAEGVGEVQEFIDICDYATGLSRMFEGKHRNKYIPCVYNQT